MSIVTSVALFFIAGLFEIGGGYLVWQWWRNGWHWGIGVIGAIVLILYGIVPTYQTENFGRVYAAYGGWFWCCLFFGDGESIIPFQMFTMWSAA